MPPWFNANISWVRNCLLGKFYTWIYVCKCAEWKIEFWMFNDAPWIADRGYARMETASLLFPPFVCLLITPRCSSKSNSPRRSAMTAFQPCYFLFVVPSWWICTVPRFLLFSSLRRTETTNCWSFGSVDDLCGKPLEKSSVTGVQIDGLRKQAYLISYFLILESCF